MDMKQAFACFFSKKELQLFTTQEIKFKLKVTVIGVFPEKKTDNSYGSTHRVNGPLNPDIREAAGLFLGGMHFANIL